MLVAMTHCSRRSTCSGSSYRSDLLAEQTTAGRSFSTASLNRCLVFTFSRIKLLWKRQGLHLIQPALPLTVFETCLGEGEVSVELILSSVSCSFGQRTRTVLLALVLGNSSRQASALVPAGTHTLAPGLLHLQH